MAFRDRARRANAAAAFHLKAALSLAVLLAAIVVWQSFSLGWRDPGQLIRLAALYGASGFIGTASGSWLAAWLTERGPRAVAAWALLSGGLTMGLGAAIFAITYRMAYSQWHEPAFTVAWAFQGVFTIAGALYFWAVLGTRMILPWAIVPLVLGALAFARRRV